MSEKIEPSLESITVTGKYKIPQTDFNVVKKMVSKELFSLGWQRMSWVGESFAIYEYPKDKKDEEWTDHIKKRRAGNPLYFSIIMVEHYKDGILVEVQCRPIMWFRIANLREKLFTENEVQEALLECKTFTKQVMSIFKGKVIEPVSVYPIIPRMEIKSRLLNLGLKQIVQKLDTAERHIVQNNFAESLKSSRTAFEKMIDWQMKKRGLEKTSNYRNDLDRLRSKGYLDLETAELLKSYYRCLSNIGVHEKTKIPVGIFEAQMGYGTTLIMLQYFANKLP